MKERRIFSFLPAYLSCVGFLLFLNSYLYHWLPLVLRPLDLDWNCTTDFSRFLACRRQVEGLQSLHYRVTQFLIMNLYKIYIVSINIYNLSLVLLLWRTLTDTLTNWCSFQILWLRKSYQSLRKYPVLFMC